MTVSFDPSQLQPFRLPTPDISRALRLEAQHPRAYSPTDVLHFFDRYFAATPHTSEDIALLVGTSGSTGAPKTTVLSRSALVHSAQATAQATGSQQSQWLLCLPVHYIAGAQVLIRSVLNGTTPVITDAIMHNRHFSSEDFLQSARTMTAKTKMVSLVPTQLQQLLDDAQRFPELLELLQEFCGILLGGAPASRSLREKAQKYQLKIFTTYGSAETAGGCVYNGLPLSSTQLRIETQHPEDTTGRIWLGGEHVAHGYLDQPQRTAEHFWYENNGTRWYRTDDIGSLSQGFLEVHGRADDIIISGGVKIAPAPIAQCLEAHPAVVSAFVFPVPHRRWGQAVGCVVYAPEESPARLSPQLQQLCQNLEPAQRPKYLRVISTLPLLSTGKPDREALHTLLREG
ncbi:AMP-binding protein [Rothia sp. CCM 9418]|uniref:AMP-binding protein n=1 Tax=unclassified Rothia (in: high G+C Gram-positive bacteria) TaxID=2689056 RepID=UPI003AD1DA0B